MQSTHGEVVRDAGLGLGVVAAVRDRSPRKGRVFTPEHIRVAVEALESRGWVPQHTAAR